jgi:hypothetical protein
MASQLETLPAGSFIYSEANGRLSRENIVIASGAGIIPAGRVLGLVTANSKYDNYRSDNAPVGVSIARGLLYAEVDATSADQPAVLIARYAEVVNARVSTEVGGDKAAGLTGLATLGIVAR